MPYSIERHPGKVAVYDMSDLWGSSTPITLTAGVPVDIPNLQDVEGAQAVTFLFIGTGSSSVWDTTKGVNIQPFADAISTDKLSNVGSGTAGIAVNLRPWTTDGGLKLIQYEVTTQNALPLGLPFKKMGARLNVTAANMTNVTGKMFAWWW